MGLTEEELPEIVRRWRNSNKRIVGLWYALEEAAIGVVRTGRPACVHGVTFAAEGWYETDMSFFTVTLPSARKLFYARPFLAPNRWGRDSLHYYGMDQTTKKWGVQETYGGKLAENITQAIARDCLAGGILRIFPRYKIVFHVHDEVVAEVDDAACLKDICAILTEPLPWAPGLILKADGFVCDFYKKE
jgi:DNA polymerase